MKHIYLECEVPADNLLETENFMICTLNSGSHGGLSISEFKAISKLTTNSRTRNLAV